MSDERKSIIVFPRGTLDAKTKEQLSKNGYLGIEADDPSAVVTVVPMASLAAPLCGDAVVQVMANVLFANKSRQEEFGRAVINIIRGKP